MLSTSILILAATQVLAFSLIGMLAMRARRGSGGINGKAEYLELRARVEVTEQTQADLADRFTRFQKREDMRQARAAKSLNQEAAEVLAGAPPAGGNLPPLDRGTGRSDLARRAAAKIRGN